MPNKKLASLTDIKILVEARITGSVCEIWTEQEEETDWLLFVFSVSAAGKRVTVRYTLTELAAHIQELEPMVYNDLLLAWME